MAEQKKYSKENKEWWSPSLGKDMELVRIGDSGTPILAFPGNNGNNGDWESHGLVNALELQLKNGYNQIYCVDSIDGESVFNTQAEPSARIQRHKQYHSYISEEVVPYIFSDTDCRFLIVAGINMGGYHAFNLTFRHPEKVGKLVAMSGIYDLKPYMDGYYDDDVYHNNPVDYVPNIGEPKLIENLQATDIRVTVSQFEAEFGESKTISNLMNSKDIRHEFDVRREEELQEWELWAEILRVHIP